MVKKRRLNILEEMALSRHPIDPKTRPLWEPSYGDWIRMVRNALRMTQADLANRAGVSQPHLAGIEIGKIDPKLSTLKKIFNAMSCDVDFEPRPRKPLNEILRGKARSVALKRLKQSMGTMALEGQAPEADVFRKLLEVRTDEILSDNRVHLWRKDNE